MKQKFLWIIFMLGIIIPIPAKSQINVDYAVFRYDTDQSYWETYYSIPRNRMTYVIQEDGNYSGLALLTMKIKKEHVSWKELSWKIQDVLPDSTQEQIMKNFIDRVQVLAPVGNYSVVLSVKDLNNSAYLDSVSYLVTIPDFPSEKIGISDIELASSIEANSQDDKNPFYKNTLLVIPNPSRVFGKRLPTLFLYVETYHLMENIPGENYEVQYSILDSEGNTRKNKSFMKKKHVDASVEIGSMPVDSLPMGTYFFHFALCNQTGEELIFKDVKFFIYNPDQRKHQNFSNIDEKELFFKSKFAHMTEDELDLDFNHAIYLTSSKERDVYKTLKEIRPKQRFLFSLWRRNDPTPATPSNEYRNEYLKRIVHTNNYYSAFKKEGWKTDRGRVHILYGPPTYIDRNPSTEGYKPYEIWQYDDIQGGVVFVFADISGFKDYILIHSTALGEVHYPEYMERILRGY